jgi:uncharacterized cupredoxin-like copper-binding protein
MSKRKRTLTLSGTALIAAVAVGGCGNSSAPKSSSDSVKATLAEWKVDAPGSDAKAGKVTIDATNGGKVEHELIVLRTDKPAGALGAGARVPETGNAGEVGNLAPGASKRVTLKLPAGHYALVCNLPGHYKLGMHRDLTVR